jgi:predicted transcriptional regulator
MNTLIYRNYRSVVASLAAVVIVGLSGLTLDRGHEGGRTGVVEIGELTTVMVGETVIAALPTVVVFGSRDVQLADRNANHADAQG